MRRSIDVTVDQSTWPAQAPPSFPSAFSGGTTSSQIHIPAMLLLIGQLTTPPLSGAASLSAFWAFFRYLFALTSGSDLRLTRAFSRLDAHQKAILSDDFGMGIPVHWLIPRLDLIAWCNGAAFLARYPSLVARPPIPQSKSGPNKSPDFVFLDSSGRIHVVECKGTQSGPNVRQRQLSHQTQAGIPSGGVVQKQAISLPPQLQGQRLACGVSIASQGSSFSSDLLIVDPPGSARLKVREDESDHALDPILRGTLSRALRVAGFPVSADIVVAPSGPSIGSRRYRSPAAERRRQSFLETRRGLARSELDRRFEDYASREPRRRFVGRQLSLELPEPLLVDKHRYTRIEITQGVRGSVFKELESAFMDASLLEVAPWVREEFTKIVVDGDGPEARMELGNVFRATLRLH